MLEIMKEWNRRKADKLYETALAYYEGTDKVKDLKQAVANFREAAELGHVDACKALGWINLYEDGYPRNASDAAHWFEAGASQGDAQCAYNLAVLYCNEPDLKDYKKALRYFTQAAEAGDAEAAFCCGQFLIGGIGTEADQAEAESWYVRAHEAGHKDAAEEIASLLEERTVGLDPESEKDCLQTAELLEKAANWHEKAAEATDSEELKIDRSGRAKYCLRAAGSYRKRASEIAQRIREGWRNAPEPDEAYGIVLAGDYDHGGRRMMEYLLTWTKKHTTCIEGVREEYSFFWFESEGQYIEICCCYHLEEVTRLSRQGVIPLSRLIPILPYDSGLTEQVRVCIENCLVDGCTSILPVTAAESTAEAEDKDLVTLVERDLQSFAKNSGASGDLPMIHAVLDDTAEDTDWCAAVLNPTISWWTGEE